MLRIKPKTKFEELAESIFNIVCIMLGSGLISWGSNWKIAIGVTFIALYVKPKTDQ